jgi:hypothetical protein
MLRKSFAAFVVSMRAERRLKFKEGFSSSVDDDGDVRYGKRDETGYIQWVCPIWFDNRYRVFVARHADGSMTHHDSLLRAHDALSRSRSESPFIVVFGNAVGAPK